MTRLAREQPEVHDLAVGHDPVIPDEDSAWLPLDSRLDVTGLLDMVE